MTNTTRRRIQAPQLLAKLGGVRDRTLRRWYTPGAPGYCGFPPPHYLGARRFFWEDEVARWESDPARSASTHPAPPRHDTVDEVAP